MRTPAFYVVIILFFIALSCKKDGSSTPLEPLSVYHKAGIGTNSPIRLFALSGEINNTAILNRFKDHDISWLDDLSEQLFPWKGPIDTLRVQQGGDMAVFDNFQYQAYSVKQ